MDFFLLSFETNSLAFKFLFCCSLPFLIYYHSCTPPETNCRASESAAHIHIHIHSSSVVRRNGRTPPNFISPSHKRTTACRTIGIGGERRITCHSSIGDAAVKLARFICTGFRRVGPGRAPPPASRSARSIVHRPPNVGFSILYNLTALQYPLVQTFRTTLLYRIQITASHWTGHYHHTKIDSYLTRLLTLFLICVSPFTAQIGNSILTLVELWLWLGTTSRRSLTELHRTA